MVAKMAAHTAATAMATRSAGLIASRPRSVR